MLYATRRGGELQPKGGQGVIHALYLRHDHATIGGGVEVGTGFGSEPDRHRPPITLFLDFFRHFFWIAKKCLRLWFEAFERP